MNSLVKKSVRILLGRGIVSLFTLMVTVFFAYELPKSIFALIALYDLVVSLSKVVTDLGLHYLIIREVPPLYHSGGRQSAIEDFVFPASMIRILVSGVISVVFWLMIVWYLPELQGAFPDLDIFYISCITAVHLMIENLHNIAIPVFAVKKLFGTNSVLESSTTFLEGIFGLTFYLLFGINQYFAGLLLGQLLIFIIRMFYLKDDFALRNFKKMSVIKIKTMLSEYFPFYLRKFFRIGFVQGEQVIITALLPLEQIANYKLAKRSSNFLRQYIHAFSDPLLIKLSESRDLEVRRKYVRTFLHFTIPVPVVLALASPWIMAGVGGEKYAGSWPILAVMYFSYVFASVSALQLNVITIFGKKTDLLLRDAIGGTLGLICTYLLVLIFREDGIAWGQLISNLILSVLAYRLSRKYLVAGTEAKSDSAMNDKI